MPVGFITHFDRKKNYGFIDSPEIAINQIFFHHANCVETYKNIYKGDKVSFEYNHRIDAVKGASNILFLQNGSLEDLRKDFETGSILKGYLKKIDDIYYVKDINNHIFISLIIAKYETHVEDVYESNLNQLIEYRLVTFTKTNKIRAVNINRHLLPGCELLKVGVATKATVLSQVKSGFRITLINQITAFIPNSLALKNRTELSIGDLIDVICIKSDEALEKVTFDLKENLEIKTLKQTNKEIFEKSLLKGDRFSARIKSVNGFGLFVSFGFSEGLLHINSIIKKPITLPKGLRKKFSKTIENVFHKGQTIEVIFEKCENDLISLNWDENTDINNSSYQNITNELIILENA